MQYTYAKWAFRRKTVICLFILIMKARYWHTAATINTTTITVIAMCKERHFAWKAPSCLNTVYNTLIHTKSSSRSNSNTHTCADTSIRAKYQALLGGLFRVKSHVNHYTQVHSSIPISVQTHTHTNTDEIAHCILIVFVNNWTGGEIEVKRLRVYVCLCVRLRDWVHTRKYTYHT